MRGLTDKEHYTLLALSSPPKPDGEWLDVDPLLEQRRAIETDFQIEREPDGSSCLTYRIVPTELGRMALSMWPLNKV